MRIRTSALRQFSLRRYLRGWRTFVHLYRGQRRKQHGSGKRSWRGAVYIAQCGRWVVDGYWRGARYPRMPDGTRFDERIKQQMERERARQ